MDIKDLISDTKEKMANKPGWFLFREEEPVVTLQDLERMESRWAAPLPDAYRIFQTHFGGGTFACLSLLSSSDRSSHSVSEWLARFPNLPETFFPISDDETGGVYGFIEKQGLFADQVYYLDMETENRLPQPAPWDFVGFFMKSAYPESTERE